MPNEKNYKRMQEQAALLKFLDDKNISHKVALDVLKRHFEPTQIQTLYPGHNPGGLY